MDPLFFLRGLAIGFAIAVGVGPITLCDASGGRGGSWGVQNVILFAPGVRGGLQRVSASGGSPIEVASTWDEHPHVVEEYPRGKIWASTSSFVFKRKMPTDVICIAANSGRVFAESLIEIGPRGGIANDSGMGKNNSGIAGLKILAEAGIAACSVAGIAARDDASVA
jgi:hypothetical protein